MPVPSPLLFPDAGLLPGGQPLPVIDAALRDLPDVPSANALAQQMLDSLPPYEASSKDIQATVNVIAKELVRVDAAKEEVRRQALPQTADDLLGAWESLLGIPVAPAGKSVEQRRATVIGYMQRLKSIATGPEWVEALSRLIGTAWTYEEYIPAADRLTNLVPNPSIEVNTSNWDLSGDHPPRMLAGGTRARVTTQAMFGTASLQIGTTAVNQGIDCSSLSVTAGRMYWVSAYVKGNVGGEAVSLVIGDNTVGLVAQAVVLTTSWQRIAFAWTPVASGTTGMALRSDVAAAQTYFLDGAMVASAGGLPMAAPPSFFDGFTAGFEWTGSTNNSPSRKISTVPANTIRVTLPYAPALATPTGGSATPATTGGVLAAGIWHYKITAYNAFGETIASADFTGTTTGSTGRNALAWTAVTGVLGYRVYRGTTSSNHTLIADVTTNSYNDVGGQAASTVVPPTTNTTQGFDPEAARNLARDITPAHIDLQFVYATGFILGVSKVGNEVL